MSRPWTTIVSRCIVQIATTCLTLVCRFVLSSGAQLREPTVDEETAQQWHDELAKLDTWYQPTLKVLYRLR